MNRRQFLQNGADDAQCVIAQLDRTGSGSSDVRRSAESDRKYYNERLEAETAGQAEEDSLPPDTIRNLNGGQG